MLYVALVAQVFLGAVAVGALVAYIKQAAQFARERDGLLEQINGLCQRIQAPAAAVAEHTAKVLPPPAMAQPVALDDDESYWPTFEPKEVLADRVMAAEEQMA